MWCAASHFPAFRRQLLVFQAPGTPIIARQVTPTTIIKQVSQAQTTVQPSTALQRSPGVQVSWGLGGALDAGVRGRASRVWVLDARVRDLGQEMLWNKVPFLCPPVQERPGFSKTTRSLAPAALSEASHCAGSAIKKRHLLTFDGAVSLEQKQST